MKQYYVYILASKTRVLYTGVTNDLKRRMWEHKKKLVPGFTRKYKVTSSRVVEKSGTKRDTPCILRVFV